MYRELHIYEENTNLVWGLIIVICTAMGTYLLTDAFINKQWNLSQLDQLLALGLFLISFQGIIKLSDPLYHFIFTWDHDQLVIHIKKGKDKIETRRIQLQDIAALKFAPYSPRAPGEALFDFSRTYLLMWRRQGDSHYQELLDMESAEFMLKVDDIVKIMRFIRHKNPEVTIPSEQADFFGL